jgi:hypothetical protein
MLVTLEDEGRRKLCQSSLKRADGLVQLFRKAGFEVVKSGDDFLVSPKKFERLYYLRATFERGSYNREEAQFTLRTLPGLPREDISADVDDPDNFVKAITERDGLACLRSLKSITTLCHNKHFPELISGRVIPAFFEKFPEGKVFVFGISESLHNLQAYLRILSPFEIFEWDELHPLGPAIGRMMAEAHPGGAELFGVSVMSVVLNFMFPNCYGVICPRLNCEVLFQLPSPAYSLSSYPREVLDLGKPGSVFEQKTSLEEMNRYLSGKKYDLAKLSKRWVCQKRFSTAEVGRIENERPVVPPI